MTEQQSTDLVHEKARLDEKVAVCIEVGITAESLFKLFSYRIHSPEFYVNQMETLVEEYLNGMHRIEKKYSNESE